MEDSRIYPACRDKEKTLTPEMATAKREQMLRDGFCEIPHIVTAEFLAELRRETDRFNDTLPPHPDTKYQGTHHKIQFADNAVYRRLAEWGPTRRAFDDLGFGDFSHETGVVVLTKEPHAPALYWHQDWPDWENPLSASPWPQKIFVSYYLEDTSVENGCLKVIPGTHRKRIPLHDQLVTAHEEGARFIEEDHPIMFSNHPDQVDVATKAGSLVLADARVLHAAYRNQTDERRDLLLLWHTRPETVPAYWDREVPQELLDRDPNADYERNRVPGDHLRA